MIYWCLVLFLTVQSECFPLACNAKCGNAIPCVFNLVKIFDI